MLTPLEIAAGAPLPDRMRGRPAATRLTPAEALDAAVLAAVRRTPCVVSFSGGRDSSLVLSRGRRRGAPRRAAAPRPAHRSRPRRRRCGGARVAGARRAPARDRGVGAGRVGSRVRLHRAAGTGRPAAARRPLAAERAFSPAAASRRTRRCAPDRRRGGRDVLGVRLAPAARRRRRGAHARSRATSCGSLLPPCRGRSGWRRRSAALSSSSSTGCAHRRAVRSFVPSRRRVPRSRSVGAVASAGCWACATSGWGRGAWICSRRTTTWPSTSRFLDPAFVGSLAALQRGRRFRGGPRRCSRSSRDLLPREVATRTSKAVLQCRALGRGEPRACSGLGRGRRRSRDRRCRRAETTLADGRAAGAARAAPVDLARNRRTSARGHAEHGIDHVRHGAPRPWAPDLPGRHRRKLNEVGRIQRRHPDPAVPEQALERL